MLTYLRDGLGFVREPQVPHYQHHARRAFARHEPAYVSIRQHTSAYASLTSPTTNTMHDGPSHVTNRPLLSSGGSTVILISAEPKAASSPETGSMHTTCAHVSIRQHTSAYVRPRARQRPALCTQPAHTSAYVSIRQHTSAYVSIRQAASSPETGSMHTTCAHVSIRQHTSAYVSIRQHTSAYVSIRQQCSRPCRGGQREGDT
jgi:hypothetical protein